MMVEQLRQAKLVLLGEMGSGKTSLVQRYVRGHYYENQVSQSRFLEGDGELGDNLVFCATEKPRMLRVWSRPR